MSFFSQGNDGRSDAMVMHSVTSAQGWSAPGVEQHRIKAEYRVWCHNFTPCFYKESVFRFHWKLPCRAF